MRTDRYDFEDSEGAGEDRAAGNPGLHRIGLRQHNHMINTIEAEIVPRMLLLLRQTGAVEAGPDLVPDPIDEGDVDELARLLLGHGVEVAGAFVEVVRQRGVPDGLICLRLLAPAVQRLAERWERQDLGYPELAVGLSGLQTLLLEVSRVSHDDPRRSRGD
jgi:hypothetical protein